MHQSCFGRFSSLQEPTGETRLVKIYSFTRHQLLVLRNSLPVQMALQSYRHHDWKETKEWREF